MDNTSNEFADIEHDFIDDGDWQEDVLSTDDDDLLDAADEAADKVKIKFSKHVIRFKKKVSLGKEFKIKTIYHVTFTNTTDKVRKCKLKRISTCTGLKEERGGIAPFELKANQKKVFKKQFVFKGKYTKGTGKKSFGSQLIAKRKGEPGVGTIVADSFTVEK